MIPSVIVFRMGECSSMSTPVISFIGWSRVGKTSFLEKLIVVLKNRGVRLAVLKEDGHEFDMDRNGKDTWRFSQAGADIVTIANKKHAAVLLNRPTDISDIISVVSGVDVIITEGYHDLNYPQIEIHRASFGKLRCVNEKNLIALVTDERLQNNVPQFLFNEIEQVADFIEEYAELNTQCFKEYKDLATGNKRQNNNVRVMIDGRETAMVPFVQDIIREINCGVLHTLRDSSIREGSEISITIRL